MMIALLTLLALTTTGGAEPPVSFKDQIAPILVKNCLGCHNPSKARGGLNMETFATLKRGGKQAKGEILVAGDPDASFLIELVRADGEPRMPLKQDPLPVSDVQLLDRWVKEGAKFDGGSEAEVKLAGLVDPLAKLPRVAMKAPIAEAVSALAFAESQGRPQVLMGQGPNLTMVDVESGAVRVLDQSFPGVIVAARWDNFGSPFVMTAGGRSGMFGAIRTYDPASGNVYQTRQGHGDAILDADLRPADQLLATSSYDRTIRLWRLGDNAEPRVLKEHTDAVHGVAFSRDGQRLASASADRTVKVWDVATGKRLVTMSDATAEVYAVAFGQASDKSDDRRIVYAAGVDRAIRAWEVVGESAALIATQLAHDAPILRLAVTDDNQTLISAGEDRAVRVWDAATLKPKFVLAAQSDWPQALAVYGSLVAVGRYDGSASVYDLKQNGKEVAVLAKAPPKVAAKPAAIPKPAAKLAAKPTLGLPSPRGGMRGQTVRVVLNGNGVGSARSVAFYENDLSAKIVPQEKPNPNQLTIDLTIANDARIGLHQILVPTSLGVPPAQFFDVTADREIPQIEPNATIAQATPATAPSVLTGAIEAPGDVDVFRIELKRGQALVLETVAGIMGSGLKANLTLMDGSGRTLAEGLQATANRDPILTHQAESDGPLFLKIADAEYSGSGNHFYRINASFAPHLREVFPLGVASGGKTKIAIDGVNLGGMTEQEIDAVSAQPGSTRSIAVRPPGALRSSFSRSAIVGEGAQTVEIEPNDALSQARALPTPGGASGRIDKDGDADLYRFSAKKGETLIIEIWGRRLGTALDSLIEIFDAHGRAIPRAILRPVSETNVAFRDHGSLSPSLRLTRWNDLAINDYVLIGRDLMRIFALPKNPDDDAVLWSSGGQRLGYLGTTPEQHPLDQKIFKVEIHPPDAKLPEGGAPPTRIDYRNDDGGPGFDKDSMLEFHPPADGDYYVRVEDARGLSGRDGSYHLLVRWPRPDFEFSINAENPAIPRGGSLIVTASVRRIDGFADPVDVALENLPPGVAATSARIDPGMSSADLLLTASEDAPDDSPPTWTAIARSADGKLTHKLDPGGTKSGWVRVIGPPDLKVWSPSPEVVLKPGSRTTIRFQIERGPAFQGRTPIDVRNLPHGVRVLNIGLNGVLITESQTEREVFLYAEPWVKPVERSFYAVGKVEANGTEHSSPPIRLIVRP